MKVSDSGNKRDKVDSRRPFVKQKEKRLTDIVWCKDFNID